MRPSRLVRVIALLAVLATAVPTVAPTAAADQPRVVAVTWSLTKPTTLGPAGAGTQLDLAVSGDGKRAFSVGPEGMSQLDLTVDPATILGTDTALTGDRLAVRKGRKYAYVADAADLQVVSIAWRKPRLLRSYPAAFRGDVTDLVVSRDGGWLYASFDGAPSSSYGVRVYSLADPARPRQVAQFRTEAHPSMLALNRAGSRLAVGHRRPGSVTLVDVSRPRRPGKLGVRILLPRRNPAVGAVFSPGGAKLYVVGRNEELVTRINVTKRSVIASKDYARHTAGEGADSIGITQDGAYLYVVFDGQPADFTLLGIRLADNAVVARVSGMHYPHAVAVSPAGSTLDRAYVLTSPSTALDLPAYLWGLIRS